MEEKQINLTSVQCINSYCPFCGAELNNGVCPNREQHLKKMCINCVFNKNGYCTNTTNMDMAKAKIMQNVPNGYEIEELKLKPLPLKDERKHCGNWAINEEMVASMIKVLVN